MPSAGILGGDAAGYVGSYMEPVKRKNKRRQVATDPIDQAFTAEVTRILDVGKGDFQRLFELTPGEMWDMKAIETRYRNIMRKLHPDKRREVDMAAVGGEMVCDEAVDIVQHGLEQAKVELPMRQVQEEAQERAKRMQEIALQQAKQARQRGTETFHEAEQQRDAMAGKVLQNVEKAMIVGSIKKVLGSKPASATAPAGANAGPTTAQNSSHASQQPSTAKAMPSGDGMTAQILQMLGKNPGGTANPAPAQPSNMTAQIMQMLSGHKNAQAAQPTVMPTAPVQPTTAGIMSLLANVKHQSLHSASQ